MLHLQPDILIFSCYQNKNEDEDLQNHKDAVAQLTFLGLPFKEVIGSYKGTEEQSILVLLTPDTQQFCEAVCDEFAQHCYLRSYCDRSTELVYGDGTTEYIGILRPASAIVLDSYTLDPVTDQKWYCQLPITE